jgi:outer membrane biosynthesis protein TonB
VEDTSAFIDRPDRHPMNKHLAATYLLSVGIVALCAIALHHTDPPPPPSRPAPAEVTGTVQPPPEKPKPTPSKPSEQRPEPTVEVAAKPLARPEPKLEPSPKVVRQVAQSTPKSRPAPTVSRGPFTVVEEGETLEDVSLRVYGSADRVAILRRANRDQITGPDGPLRAGMSLRTP